MSCTCLCELSLKNRGEALELNMFEKTARFQEKIYFMAPSSLSSFILVFIPPSPEYPPHPPSERLTR